MPRKPKIKEEGYLSNKEMYSEVIECQTTGKISEKLGRMFMILARRYATKPNFSGYSYKDEMISNGVMSCCAALHKFDPDRSDTPNPFSYYTSIIHNSFIQTLNKEKKQQEIRDELLLAENLNPSYSYMDRHGSDYDV